MDSSSPPHQHPPHQHHHPVRPLAQYALVLSGGVSLLGKLEGQFAVSNTSWSGEPVALDVCYRGFERHLFQPNGEFLSQKYSLGRAVQALREYERRHNHTHSMVVMTRPDLLLFGRGLLLSDSARFPPDEVSHWADYYFVTSSRIAQRFGELYHRCWRDDLGGPGCLTDQGSHLDGFERSNHFFVKGFVTPGKRMRYDDNVTDCVDFALIRKLCAKSCVATWTNASLLQLCEPWVLTTALRMACTARSAAYVA